MKSKLIAPIAVLSVIAIVCATVLTLVNYFWYVSDDDRFAAAVKSIIIADSFDTVYDNSDSSSDGYQVINDFNQKYGGYLRSVDKVRVAVGGEKSGCYLIQSTDRGYSGAYVQILTGFDFDGTILGIKLLSFDSINNRTGSVNWDEASNAAKGKTTVQVGDDWISKAGVTETLKGVEGAINLASQFYQLVILDETEKSKIVTNPAKIAQLDQLFGTNSQYAGEQISQYIFHPVRLPETDIDGVKVSVVGMYTADDIYTIIEVKSTLGRYGGWTLLVLLNVEDGTVAAISPTANSISVGENRQGELVDASVLDSADVLTRLFKGKTKEQIDPMPKYLEGTAHATQTNTGLKTAVFYALDKSEDAKTALAEFLAAENQQGGV